MNGSRSRTLLTAAAAGAVAYAGWRLFRSATGASLHDRVVLITGGSRGLGLLMAQEFAAHGCRLAICARDAAQLERARGELTRRGAPTLAVPCDVTDPDQVRDFVRRAHDRFGRIDILVNNASIIQSGPVAAMTLEDFRRAMDVNFFGTVHATLAVLPYLRAQGDGRIVNITSIGGKVSVPHLLPYDAAKFAAVGFSEGLHAELAQEGIAVTTVVPGLMRTGSPVNAFFKGQHAREFAWFSLGSALPLTAMSARRAAARIVEAARHREAYVTLSWQASLLRGIHDLLPGTTARLLGAVNRALPDADTPAATDQRRGMELAHPVAPSPLTALMNRAALETNQFGGAPRPSPRHADRIGLAGPADRGDVGAAGDAGDAGDAADAADAADPGDAGDADRAAGDGRARRWGRPPGVPRERGRGAGFPRRE
jgi:NAD(P)-dependent dehydrogenase (short-subunit alcohol dehydrogenase family)